MCPICKSGGSRILYSINSEQAAQHFVLKEAEPARFAELQSHIETIWHQPTCRVVQCDSCGFCYSNPYVAGDRRFYTLAYRRLGFPTRKWEYELTYETFTAKGMSGFTMLEIGAGNGAFVKRIAPSLTRKENILCTEYSDFGIGEIQRYGISCLSDDIRAVDSEEYEGLFDVICMFQVLEHMDDLNPLFQRINWMARRNANLFIAVPNPRRIEFNELNGALLDMPPNHIGRWNRQCFAIMAERHGWNIERYEMETGENFTSKAKTFSIYRFLRKAQESRTLANRIRQLTHPYLRRILQVAGVCIYNLAAPGAYTRLRSRELGESQWVHLRKV